MSEPKDRLREAAFEETPPLPLEAFEQELCDMFERGEIETEKFVDGKWVKVEGDPFAF